MKKLLVIGDPHADNSNLDKISQLFDDAEKLAKQRKISTIVVLGDLMDTKEIIRGKTLNFLQKRLSSSKLEWIILVGNHDWFNLECNDHSLETFKRFPNITVVDRPTVIDDALFMPYYDDLKKFSEDLLAKSKDHTHRTLFMHQGVVGFDYGNGHVADGTGHGELNFASTVSFHRVISGHFHKHAEQGNLVFLGTPFTQDFGETDQDKYLGVYNPETFELELVETSFPKHRTLSLDCSLFPNPSEEVKKLVGKSKDHFRIRLVGTELEIAALDITKFPKIKFLEEPTDAEQVETESIKDTDSNEQKFLTWAKDIKKLDEETTSLGLEILGEAK